MPFRFLPITLLLLTGAAAGASAQQPLTAPLPADSAVRVGRLENGLTYYIRVNDRPENRAELRLAVNAGSVLETEAQRGVAHFVEHMAFNGTASFPKQALIDYLESIGMRFGPDLNAYTGFDETVYMLQVPTDSAGLLERGVAILGEWADDVVFDSAQVAAERGVVIEEWRLGRGSQQRMWDQQLPVLFHGSLYAERLPIGERAVLDTVSRATLVDFYRTWYRPELMAVVAVGDFDPDHVERLIRAAFGDLVPRPDAPARRSPDVPVQDTALISIVTDAEAANTLVEVYWKRPPEPDRTVADYRRGIVEDLYDQMLGQRLDELTEAADPPYVAAGGGSGSLVRGADTYFLRAMVREGGALRGLEAMLREAERVRRFGFTASELERAKAELLRRVERMNAERDNLESAVFASEYVRAYLEAEPFPGIPAEYALHQRFVPEITIEEVNALADRLMPGSGRVLLVRAPAKPGAAPAPEQVRGVFRDVQAAELAPYEDRVADRPLIAAPPEPGRVVEEERLEAVGALRWTLGNGARVILKPTDFKADQVLLRAFSAGGTSLVPDSMFVDATLATAAVAEMGLADFSRSDLDKQLAGKAVSVMPLLGAVEEGFSGSASPRDLDALFELLHLYFTAPRADSAAFESFRARVRAMLENRDQDPGSLFYDTLQATLTQDHPRGRPITTEWLDAFDLPSVMRVYRERFADAGDFTFVLVGAFEPDSVRPLVERWLASLPSRPGAERWRDVGIEPPAGVVERTVRAGIEPQARTQIVFTGDVAYSDDVAYRLASLADVLRLRLRDVLREDLGGTYGVSISASPDRAHDEYSFTIAFGAAPERLDALVAETFRQIERLSTEGPTADELAKVKEAQRRGREVALKENGFWIGQLVGAARWGEDPAAELAAFDARVAELTAAALAETARRFLDPANYVRVSLLPEGSR